MIITLFVILVVLVISSWITLMYISWKKSEEEALKPLDQTAVLAYWDKITRLLRRGYYSSMFYTRKTAHWGNEKIGHAFFTLFPKAAHAFEKRNPLTGLETGPSSYFLLTISETKAALTKPRRRKKIV
jgi:hypothetical protein